MLAMENERVAPAACTSTYWPGIQVNVSSTDSVDGDDLGGQVGDRGHPRRLRLIACSSR